MLMVMLLAALASSPPPGDAVASAPPPVMHQTFISPAGEPFRPTPGDPSPFDAWFAGADTNHDGALDKAEFRADAETFFKRLDANNDGTVDGFEISAYEHKIAPELIAEAEAPVARMRAGGEGPEGERRAGRPGGYAAGRADHAAFLGLAAPRGHASILNEPEPVAGADFDLNSKVSADEWRRATDRRFDLLDTAHAGVLTHNALFERLPKPPKPGKGPKPGRRGRPEGPR